MSSYAAMEFLCTTTESVKRTVLHDEKKITHSDGKLKSFLTIVTVSPAGLPDIENVLAAILRFELMDK